MLVHKSNGIVFVAEDPEDGVDEEQLQELNDRYGESNVVVRPYYVKEYAVVRNGEEQTVKVPYFSQSGALNRHEIRSQHKMLKNPLHGIQKTNAQARTKHMRTRSEIRYDRAGRKRK